MVPSLSTHPSHRAATPREPAAQERRGKGEAVGECPPSARPAGGRWGASRGGLYCHLAPLKVQRGSARVERRLSRSTTSDLGLVAVRIEPPRSQARRGRQEVAAALRPRVAPRRLDHWPASHSLARPKGGGGGVERGPREKGEGARDVVASGGEGERGGGGGARGEVAQRGSWRSGSEGPPPFPSCSPRAKAAKRAGEHTAPPENRGFRGRLRPRFLHPH